jgi:phage baseplate assembly protein W
MTGDPTAEYYGRGPAHPLAIGPTGGVQESSGFARVEQSIRIILGTQHGERIMRPDFGADLASLAFAGNTSDTGNLARHLVETALSRWEPRIEVVDVQVAAVVDAATLVVTVAYRLVGAADVRRVVMAVPTEVAG